MLTLIAYKINWVAVVALPAAFILTFWKGRSISKLAAVSYSIGTVVGIGFSTYAWLFIIWMNYHLTDGPPNDTYLLGALLPIGTFLYGVGSVALLWPGIPQEKAFRHGKTLHLIILPLLVSLIFLGEFLQFQGQVFSGMKWLVYGPLWFRIRQSYANNPDGSPYLEP